MGLAIGTHGSNISQARRIQGIISVDLEEESSTFRISGLVGNFFPSYCLYDEVIMRVFTNSVELPWSFTSTF